MGRNGWKKGWVTTTCKNYYYYYYYYYYYLLLLLLLGGQEVIPSSFPQPILPLPTPPLESPASVFLSVA